jgi:hypothetical protein
MGTGNKKSSSNEKEIYNGNDGLMAYLSYNNIGNFGRLGNQMFQYASLLGLANETGHKPIANLSNSNLQDCFELGSVEDKVNESPQSLIQETDFSYSPSYATGLDPHINIDLLGYFQSSKYFDEYNTEAEVKSNFTFKEEIREKAGEKLPDGVLVSIHIRRTDYVKLSEFHTNQPLEYYEKGMDEFKNYRPVVFSDDIEWCKDNLSFLDEDTVYMDNDQYTDLCLMSWCNGHIIANSSFSWWGAYLGGGKTVAPKNWFGPKGPKNWQDIYCKEWRTI